MRTTIFQLHIPTRTILKLLLWAFLTTVAVKLWPELVYLSLSLLLAVALGPVVNRLCALGLGRGASVSLIAVGLLGCAALFVAFVLPPLVHQACEVAANFPAFRRSAQQHMPSNPFVRSVMTQLLQMPSSPEVVHQLNKPPDHRAHLAQELSGPRGDSRSLGAGPCCGDRSGYGR